MAIYFYFRLRITRAIGEEKITTTQERENFFFKCNKATTKSWLEHEGKGRA